MSETLDTGHLWKQLDGLSYLVMRPPPGFPVALRNSDIDVLALDASKVALNVATYWAESGFETLIRDVGNGHVQVDVKTEALRLMMFDIYSPEAIRDGGLLSSSFAYWALARRRSIPIASTHHEGAVWIPSKVDEAVFRYSEYVAAFWTGRSKDWHVDWILANLSDEEQGEFLYLAHHFVQNPHVREIVVGSGTRGDSRRRGLQSRSFRERITKFAYRRLPTGVVAMLRRAKRVVRFLYRLVARRRGDR